MDKPSIIEVVGNYVELRQSGKEYVGLCPFHGDKNPSLSINDEKGLFYCFACGEGGDLIDFLMKLNGVTFKEALAELGIENGKPPRGPRITPVRMKAEKIIQWAKVQTRRCNSLLREIGRKLEFMERVPILQNELESFRRKWSILEDLADDLNDVKMIVELYANRAVIEALLADADPDELPPEPFPELTEAYRERLRKLVTGEI